MSCYRHNNRSIKQYTTLELLCEYKDEFDEPLPLIDISIKSEVRNGTGILVDTLEVVILDSEAGRFLLKQKASELPVDRLMIDILFTKDGKRVQSDTVYIDIEPSITEP